MKQNSEIVVSLTWWRVASMLFLYVFLGLYLWGIQLAYDKAHLGLLRAMLFSLIIFGGGLSWDILKEISRLADDRISVFAKAMTKAIIFMLLYAAFFVIGFKVLGDWAGIQTIGVLVYLGVSVASLFLFFSSFEAAVNAVTKSNQ